MTRPGVKKQPWWRGLPGHLLLAGLALEAAFALLLGVYDWRDRLLPFLGISLLAFGPFLYSALRALRDPGPASRAGLLVVLGLAALFRITVLPVPPTLSDDIYRYVWEGRVQLEGWNPYLHPPDSEQLAPYRDAVYEGVNHKEIPAIYPPVSQLLFRCVAGLGGGIFAMKGVMVLLDLALVVALMGLLGALKRPPALALIYGWNPLAVIEVAGSGHNEPLALLLLVLGLWGLVALRARALPVVALTLAGLAKVVPFFLMPVVLWRRARWPVLLLVPATVLLLYLPYLNAGASLFNATSQYAARWRHNDFLFAGINWMIGMLHSSEDPRDTLRVAKVVAALGYLALAGTLIARRADPGTAARLLLWLLIALSPTVHPWYVLWTIPWLALRWNLGWVYLNAAVLLSYLCLLPDADGGVDYRVPPLVLWIQWAPWAALLVVRGRRRGGVN